MKITILLILSDLMYYGAVAADVDSVHQVHYINL